MESNLLFLQKRFETTGLKSNQTKIPFPVVFNAYVENSNSAECISARLTEYHKKVSLNQQVQCHEKGGSVLEQANDFVCNSLRVIIFDVEYFVDSAEVSHMETVLMQIQICQTSTVLFSPIVQLFFRNQKERTYLNAKPLPGASNEVNAVLEHFITEDN